MISVKREHAPLRTLQVELAVLGASDKGVPFGRGEEQHISVGPAGIPHGDTLGETVDREALARVVSPVVVPADRVEGAAALLSDPGVDLAALVEALLADGPLVLLEAPPQAMRVSGPDDIRVLEALTRPV